jgi:hypothetical protein
MFTEESVNLWNKNGERRIDKVQKQKEGGGGGAWNWNSGEIGDREWSLVSAWLGMGEMVGGGRGM